MKFPVLSPQARKVAAVGIATLILSTLAHADDSATSLVTTTVTNVTDLLNGKPPVSAVPEANAGLVLIPVVAAMLFFSMRRFWFTKAAPGSEGQKGSH